MLFGEAQFPPNNLLVRDRLSMYGITCTLIRVNGNPLRTLNNSWVSVYD